VSPNSQQPLSQTARAEQSRSCLYNFRQICKRAKSVDKLPSVFNALIPCNMAFHPSLFNWYTPTTRRVSSLTEELGSIPAVSLHHRHSRFGVAAVVAGHCGEPVKQASSFGKKLSPAQRERHEARCCSARFRKDAARCSGETILAFLKEEGVGGSSESSMHPAGNLPVEAWSVFCQL